MDDFELFLNEGPKVAGDESHANSETSLFDPLNLTPARPEVRSSTASRTAGAGIRHDRDSQGYQGFSSGKAIDANVSALTLAERHLVGALLADNACYGLVSHLRPDDFCDVVCGRIFRVIQDVMEGEIPGTSFVDPITCSAFPEVGRLITPARLRGMVEQVGQISEETLGAHADLIHRQGARRHLAKRIAEVQILVENEASTETQISRAIRLVNDTVDESMGQGGFRGMGHFSTLALDEMTRSIEEGTSVTGILTPWDELNEKICSLMPGQVVIVAARPAMGKTSFAFGLVRGAAKQGKYVQVFSLEMGGVELSKRMLSMESGVPGERIRRGTLSQEDFVALGKANERIKSMPILLDEEPRQTMAKIRASARKAARMGQLDMIVIDYLQLIEGEGGGKRRQEEITDISRETKLLAKELGVPCIMLSQLNRNLEQRPDKRPVMSDLRESGAIEQDADVIIFLYRDEVYNPNTLDVGVAEIIIGKQRAGSTGTIRLKFNKETTEFESLEAL